MGSAPSVVPPRLPVSAGRLRLCVIGFKVSHHTGRARRLAAAIAAAYPEQYETWYHFDWPSAYREYLAQLKANELNLDESSPLFNHTSSPFCWLEEATGSATAFTPLGGRDRFCEWATERFPASEEKNAEIVELASTPPSLFSDAWVDETPGTAQPSGVVQDQANQETQPEVAAAPAAGPDAGPGDAVDSVSAEGAVADSSPPADDASPAEDASPEKDASVAGVSSANAADSAFDASPADDVSPDNDDSQDAEASPIDGDDDAAPPADDEQVESPESEQKE